MTAPQQKGSFRDLDVWKRGCNFVVQVYDLAGTLPPAERYEVAKHMRKTVWSIPLNIAEGCARYRRTEFIHFLRIAAGSLAEMETFLVIGRRLGMGDPKLYDLCEATAAEIGRMLHGLIYSLRRRE